jgi:hypothetical protein
MSDKILFHSGYGEQQRGGNRFRFCFDDIQNRVVPVAQVLSAYTADVVVGAREGDRVLVLVGNDARKAGLYTIDSGGRLVRPGDFMTGFTLNTTLVVLDTATNGFWRVQSAVGQAAVIDSADLLIARTTTSGIQSLVTYVDDTTGTLSGVVVPNKRYLVTDRANPATSGVWYHNGIGVVRPRDMETPF